MNVHSSRNLPAQLCIDANPVPRVLRALPRLDSSRTENLKIHVLDERVLLSTFYPSSKWLNGIHTEFLCIAQQTL